MYATEQLEVEFEKAQYSLVRLRDELIERQRELVRLASDLDHIRRIALVAASANNSPLDTEQAKDALVRKVLQFNHPNYVSAVMIDEHRENTGG